MTSLMRDPHARPFAALLACCIVLAVADGGQGRFLSAATAYSTFETFATTGLVALGLGLAIMIREFDLSVVGLYSLSGCVAVLLGGSSPLFGLTCALLVGAFAGLVQGVIITRLRLSSVGVTLGGLLVCVGLAFVITENRSVPYDDIRVAYFLTSKIWGVFSIRSLIVIVIFLALAFIIGFTRYGRDIIAVGSDRRAAGLSGVNVSGVIIAVFVFSGVAASLAGALLSYSLASAAPTGLSDVIPPAAAAAIIGGVSLAGGAGRPLGIAAGMLTIAVLRAGFNSLGAPTYMNDLSLGLILLLVGILDGPKLPQRLAALRR